MLGDFGAVRIWYSVPRFNLMFSARREGWAATPRPCAVAVLTPAGSKAPVSKARRQLLRIGSAYGLAIVLTPIVILAYLNFLMAYTPIFFGDADWYATAWPALTGDAPLYPPAILEPHLTARPPTFNQPPSTAIFAPLALDRTAWGLLMGACLAAGLIIIWPRVGLMWTVLLTAVLLVWLPIQSAVTWANLNSFIFLMFAVALRWPRAAPYAIGFAISAKVIPIFMLPWVFAIQGWRGVVVALAIPLATTAVVVGFTSSSVVWEFVLVRMNEIHLPTISVTDLLHAPAWVGYVAASGISVISWRLKSFSIGLVACLVAVPALHVHYFIWLLVPLLAIWPKSWPRNQANLPQPT